MLLDWLGVFVQHWPAAGLIATLLIGVFLIARYWNSSEMKDMRARLDYFDRQMRGLRYRDQCYFEYVIYDEGYHHDIEYTAARARTPLDKHTPFLLFRDNWMKDRGLENEDQIWQ